MPKMSENSKQGGCQCGALRYQTTTSPVRVMACHCTACKRRTGAPYGVGVYFNEDEVEFTAGNSRTYEFKSDTSGRWMKNKFCPNCGTAVSWTLEMRPGLVGIAGGTFDDPNWYTIDGHIWTRSARHDMCYPDAMPVHEKAMS